MRNLKKVLALVLALVMSFALLSTANATSFTDDADIDHTEAVEVLTTAGVIAGMGDGTFAPDGTLTRAQAAKIIAYVAEGAEKAGKMVSGAASFTDVKATHWSAAYIAYGVEAGILSGMGDGTFAPEGTLTGYQFAKMLLVAMGVNGTFTGTNWIYNVASAAEDAGLFAEMDDVLMNSDLTREHACQMALNAMKYSVEGTTKYEVTDSANKEVILTTTDMEKAYTLKALVGGSSAVTVVKDTKATLLAKVHGITLKEDVEVDDFATPGYIYSKGEKGKDGYVELKYAYDCVLTLVSDGTYSDANNLLKSKKIDEKVLKTDSNSVRYVNGVSTRSLTGENAKMHEGDVISFYKNSNDYVVVTGAHYVLAEVTKVEAATDKDDKDVVAQLTINSTKFYNNDIAGYDASVLVEGTVILAAAKTSAEGTANDVKIIDYKLPTVVSGKVDAIKNDQYRINGVFYKLGSYVWALSIGDEGSFYLDAAGKLGAYVEVETTVEENIAYVYNTAVISVGATAGTINDDGVEVGKTDAEDKNMVYTVNENGEKKSYVVAKGANLTAFSSNLDNVKGKLVEFELNSDGEISKLVSAGSEKSGLDLDGKTAVLDTGKYLLSSTKFVFVYETVDSNKKANGYAVATKTGFANVYIDNQNVAYLDKNGLVSVVFVGAAEDVLSVTSDVKYAVVTDNEATQTMVEKDKVYTYGTTAGDLSFKGSGKSLTNGDLIAYTITDGYATIADSSYDGMEEVNTSDVVLTEEYVVIDGDTFVNGSIKLHTIELDKDGNYVSLTDGINRNLDDDKYTEVGYDVVYDAKGVTDLYVTIKAK